MFVLVKWYLDLVTDDGVAFILYVAGLRWGPVRLGYASVLETRPGQRSRARWVLGRVRWPMIEGDTLVWRNERLSIRGEWHRETAPIEHALVPGIRWHCHVPKGRAVIHHGGERFEGLGYVECLRVTVPPSRLPFRTLRWGRHLSDRHSYVWIEWSGDTPRAWTWLDGVPAAPGASLAVRDARTIRDHRIPFTTLHEHKQLGRSTLMMAGQPPDQGWTVREEVTR